MDREKIEALIQSHIPAATTRQRAMLTTQILREIKQRYGRYKPDSTITHKKNAVGSIDRENKPWTEFEVDSDVETLLRMYLWCKPLAEIQAVLQRSPDAIGTKLRTLAAKRKLNNSQQIYTPPSDWKDYRSGRHFSFRDNYLLSIATGPTGRRDGGYRIEYISNILHRMPEDVRGFLQTRAAKKAKGFDAERKASSSLTVPVGDIAIAEGYHVTVNNIAAKDIWRTE